jgi:hypothetical protein
MEIVFLMLLMKVFIDFVLNIKEEVYKKINFFKNLKDNPERMISFKLLIGTEARDYIQLAKREHLKGTELGLRIMEDGIKQIYNDYVYLKKREAAMRITTGKNLIYF